MLFVGLALPVAEVTTAVATNTPYLSLAAITAGTMQLKKLGMEETERPSKAG